MKVTILSIGDELTLGFIPDTNAAWLARRVAAAGGDVIGFRAVPDRLEAIVLALEEAARASEIILATGGLGPTADDLTRDAIARWAGAPLKEDAEQLERIRERFRRRNREMPESNRVQARIPQGAKVLPNDWGTAPGFQVAGGGALAIALPGVPSEMKEMFAASVALFLAEKAGGAVVRSLHLRAFGEPESKIGEKIRDLMERGKNPEVGTQAGEGVITVRATARAPSADAADALLWPCALEIRRRLGEAVFGEEDETLFGAAARLLLERGIRFALAESCTGGLLAARLTEFPGISKVFVEGAVTYANEAKIRRLGVPPGLLEKHGAVSAEVAGAMARGIRTSSGADLGLSITGVAGPDGGTSEKPVGLVYLGLDFEGALESRRLFVPGERAEVRDRAAKFAADWIRRRLLG